MGKIYLLFFLLANFQQTSSVVSILPSSDELPIRKCLPGKRLVRHSLRETLECIKIGGYTDYKELFKNCYVAHSEAIFNGYLQKKSTQILNTFPIACGLGHITTRIQPNKNTEETLLRSAVIQNKSSCDSDYTASFPYFKPDETTSKKSLFKISSYKVTDVYKYYTCITNAIHDKFILQG